MDSQQTPSQSADPASSTQAASSVAGESQSQTAQTQTGQQESQQSQTPPPASTGLSKEDIATIVRTAVGEVVPREEDRPMDPAEVRRLLNVFEPTPELVSELLEGGDKALGALVRIIDGVHKQATTVAALQAKQMVEKLTGRLGPLESYYQEAQLNALKSEFEQKYPDLKGYDPLILSVKDALLAKGFKGTKEEAFKAVAEGTRQLLKTLPGFQPQAQSQQSATTGGNSQTRTHSMSTLTTGGQGSAATGNSKSGMPPGMEILKSRNS